MGAKFKLTDESITIFGRKLFRIEALVSFGCVDKGDKGGFVEKETNLSQNGNAWVYGNAWVSGNAQVYGNAQVSGNAQVYGDARVSGNAQVYGDARVFGNAQVYGNARVYGNAQVYGDARVYGNAQVYGDAWVSGNAQVYGASLNAKMAFTAGLFVDRSNGTPLKTTVLHEEACSYCDNTYVLGDYKIEPIYEPEKEKTSDNPKEITIDGAKYRLVEND